MTAKTAADRQREARDRRRGGPPREPDPSPLAAARRKRAQGARIEDLTAEEAGALREYNAAAARARRAGA